MKHTEFKIKAILILYVSSNVLCVKNSQKTGIIQRNLDREIWICRVIRVDSGFHLDEITFLLTCQLLVT